MLIRTIIQSALVRLTLYYVAIIMVLSLSFSVIIYNLSNRELSQGLRKQPPIFNQTQVDQNSASFNQYRQERLDTIAQNLRFNLLIFNSAVFLLGGPLSYVLAKRTFEPIEKSIEAQSRFTADASHELKTPLTAMKTEIEVALRDPSLSKAEAIELLESNLEEVIKLTSLSNALLRLARFDASSVELKRSSAKKLAQLTQRNIQKTLKSKKVNFKLKVVDFKLDVDSDAMAEALVILVDNAVKYGDLTKPVTLSARLVGSDAVFEVTNFGSGISTRDRPYIFDRFYRADLSRSSQNVEGYGLGLSLAKQITALHNGQISAKSQLEKTTTFTIVFPQNQIEAVV